MDMATREKKYNNYRKRSYSWRKKPCISGRWFDRFESCIYCSQRCKWKWMKYHYRWECKTNLCIYVCWVNYIFMKEDCWSHHSVCRIMSMEYSSKSALYQVSNHIEEYNRRISPVSTSMSCRDQWMYSSTGTSIWFQLFPCIWSQWFCTKKCTIWWSEIQCSNTGNRL